MNLKLASWTNPDNSINEELGDDAFFLPQPIRLSSILRGSTPSTCQITWDLPNSKIGEEMIEALVRPKALFGFHFIDKERGGIDPDAVRFQDFILSGHTITREGDRAQLSITGNDRLITAEQTTHFSNLIPTPETEEGQEGSPVATFRLPVLFFYDGMLNEHGGLISTITQTPIIYPSGGNSEVNTTRMWDFRVGKYRDVFNREPLLTETTIATEFFRPSGSHSVLSSLREAATAGDFLIIMKGKTITIQNPQDRGLTISSDRLAAFSKTETEPTANRTYITHQDARRSIEFVGNDIFENEDGTFTGSQTRFGIIPKYETSTLPKGNNPQASLSDDELDRGLVSLAAQSLIRDSATSTIDAEVLYADGSKWGSDFDIGDEIRISGFPPDHIAHTAAQTEYFTPEQSDRRLITEISLEFNSNGELRTRIGTGRSSDLLAGFRTRADFQRN